MNDSVGTYFGLNGLDLDEHVVQYPRGITLAKTYAFVMQPAILAFTPAEPGKPHPGPWKEAKGGGGRTITSELFIPESAFATAQERIEVAQTIVFLLKLWAHPGVELVVGSNMSFGEIPLASDMAAIVLQPPLRKRHFKLMPMSYEGVIEATVWTADYFETVHRLLELSPEFRLASSALDAGQFYEETALAMVSLWGALEAIFSPSTTELKFRVSALIAAYLYPPGAERLAQQRRISKLYDKRSAAAHGKPRHSADDLLQTFELLRAVLIAFIRAGEVPSKDELEANLFGAG